ncbi:MAG: hypothetical protein JNK82_14715, partial [Myxococcaceae bacterium]|nr:hypothetical protein [Myxococcaceae bacterium]
MRNALFSVTCVFLSACGVSELDVHEEGAPSDEELSSTAGQPLVSCNRRSDTGYTNG